MSESPVLAARPAANFSFISSLRYEVLDAPASMGPADALRNAFRSETSQKRAPQYTPEVVEDLLSNPFCHLGIESVPAEHASAVVSKFLLEARLLEFVTDEHAGLPLVEAEFNLV